MRQEEIYWPLREEANEKKESSRFKRLNLKPAEHVYIVPCNSKIEFLTLRSNLFNVTTVITTLYITY